MTWREPWGTKYPILGAKYPLLGAQYPLLGAKYPFLAARRQGNRGPGAAQGPWSR